MGNSTSVPTTNALQAYCDHQLKRRHLAPREPPYISGRADDDEDDDEPPTKPGGGLPPPPDQASVDIIGQLVAESETSLRSAKAKLESRESAHYDNVVKDDEAYVYVSPAPLPGDIDWELTHYMLFAAWIVNFGRDPSIMEGANPRRNRKSRITETVEYDRQNEDFIHAAAAFLELEWIPFIDLALAPYSNHETPASGPYAGVFVSRGEKPFMILAFKGTTFAKEVTTDALANAKQFGTIFHGNLMHTGMGQGLFETFSYVGETKPAFDTIMDGLNRVAGELKGESERKVPLYVTGHSLGAGYCILAYAELTRKLAENAPTSFDLYDSWNYGSPRVMVNAGVLKLKTVLAATNRHFYRVARRYDLVPNFPVNDLLGHTYKHVDVGYRLTPDAANGEYWNVRISEVGALKPPINDGFPTDDNWFYHWPERYQEAIKKILDNPADARKK